MYITRHDNDRMTVNVFCRKKKEIALRPGAKETSRVNRNMFRRERERERERKNERSIQLQFFYSLSADA